MRDAALPSLSRRFTLLRAASGDPVTLDDLKSKLADQRARGAENYLSEEEADMFLQTLGRMRSKPSASSTSSDSTHSPARGSLRSTDTTVSSVTSTSGSSKRYSNNMFGSGKFRDHTYLRSVAKDRAGKGSAGKRSAANSSISSRTYTTSDSTIPEEPTHTDTEPSAHDSDTSALASGVETSTSELEQSIVKTFQQGHLRRASMALHEVMREFEEKVDGDGDGDGDDKILIPRSPAPERNSSLKRLSVSGCVNGDVYGLNARAGRQVPFSPINRSQCVRNRDSCLSRPPNANGRRDVPLHPISLPSRRDLTHPSITRIHSRYAKTHDTPRGEFRSR